jgi:hypothetical protein
MILIKIILLFSFACNNFIMLMIFFLLFQLADLHVYIVPPELWRERYNNLLNQNVTETISAGIIRYVKYYII